MSVTFHPIGTVIIERNRYFITLDKPYFEAAFGLDEYSHIQVIWWFHLYDSEESRHYYILDKPYTNGPEKVGVLASRSPIRPNPIAVTSCALLSLDRENGRLEVDYLDAEDGTPVLDLKPYEPSIDRVRDVTMPPWCRHWPKWYEESGDFDWNAEFHFPE